MSSLKLTHSIKPRVRLFLSADLIGSTALKQSSRSGLADGLTGKHWFSDIFSFFSGWGDIFSANWELFQKTLPQEINRTKHKNKVPADFFMSLSQPSPWKTAGDEIIYQVELESCEHLMLAILAWQETARRLSASSKHNYRLHAWIATFPIANSEVVLNTQSVPRDVLVEVSNPIMRNLLNLEDYYRNVDSSSKAYTLDFIGPSIDTGFRIGSLSTERKMILSVELAYVLSGILSRSPYKSISNSLRIYYDGRSSLKGLLGGYGYPVFWIDSDPTDELNKVEDRLLHNSESNLSDIRNFCLEFIEKVGNDFVISLPFIPSCKCDCCKANGVSDFITAEIKKIKSSLMSDYGLESRQGEEGGANESEYIDPSQREFDRDKSDLIIMLKRNFKG